MEFITVFFLKRNTYVEDLIEEVVVAPEQVMGWIRKGESKLLSQWQLIPYKSIDELSISRIIGYLFEIIFRDHCCQIVLELCFLSVISSLSEGKQKYSVTF